MLNKFSLITVICLSATTASAALNTNQISFSGNIGNNNSNIVGLDFTGNYNKLAIGQTLTDQRLNANKISIKIDGDYNGSYAGGKFTGAAARSGLTPGTLTQRGFNNSMRVKVKGSRNQFAFLQDGSNNRIIATINGTNNQATIRQYGTGNIASLKQNGTGNIANITQRSW